MVIWLTEQQAEAQAKIIDAILSQLPYGPLHILLNRLVIAS